MDQSYFGEARLKCPCWPVSVICSDDLHLSAQPKVSGCLTAMKLQRLTARASYNPYNCLQIGRSLT